MLSNHDPINLENGGQLDPLWKEARMKTRIVTNMFIAAFVVVFFIGEIAGAKSIKVALEDEVMCRNDVLVDGIVSNPGDRYCIRGNEAEWSVSGGNEFLDGIMIVVLNANMDGPPPFFTINGVAFGSFELFPDQYPESSWVGTYNSF